MGKVKRDRLAQKEISLYESFSALFFLFLSLTLIYQEGGVSTKREEENTNVVNTIFFFFR